MFPTLTVADPENARILFDLVNEEFSKSVTDEVNREHRMRLVDMMIALHAEMNPTTPGADDDC